MPAVSEWMLRDDDVPRFVRWEDTSARALVAQVWYEPTPRWTPVWRWETNDGHDGIAQSRIIAQMMADHRADACGTCDHKCPLFGGRTICALAPDHETPHQDGNIHTSWDNMEYGARAVDFSLDGTRRGPSVNR